MLYHITWPRSGCQLLIWTLLKYASENINYPFEQWNKEEYYNFTNKRKSIHQIFNGEEVGKKRVFTAGPLVYATFADTPSGGFIPYPNFLHCHDLPKYIIIEQEDKCLFQYRHPILALISHIGWGINDEKIYDIKFSEYLKKGIVSWKEWVHEWPLNEKYVNNYHLEYTKLLENPKERLIEIINFLDLPYNKRLLNKLLKKMDISPKHVYAKDFDMHRIYKKELVILEKDILSELKRLKIPRIYK